jgi:PAS domain S-box-containing protein
VDDQAAPSGSSADRHHLVLLVDGHQGRRWRHERTLRTADPTILVDTAPTLAAALDRITTAEVDLVVLALDLPDSQGLPTLTRMLEAAAATPIVALVPATDGDELGLLALRTGAQDYLLEHRESPAELTRAVRYALERERASRQLTDHRAEQAALAAIDAAGRRLAELEPFLASAASSLHDVLGGATVELTVRTSEHEAAVSAGPAAAGTIEPSRRAERELVARAGVLGTLRVTAPEGGRLSAHQRSFIGRAASLFVDTIGRFETSTALTERQKELRAIHEVAAAMQQEVTLSGLADRIVKTLASAFRHPELVRLQLTVDGHTAEAGVTSSPPATELRARISAGGRRVGELQVGYVEPRPWLEPEERDLVESVAELVGLWATRERAQLEGRRQSLRLDRVLATVPVGVVFVDADGRLAFANGAARTLFQLGPDDPLERTFDDPAFRIEAIDGGELPRGSYPFEQVRATGEPVWDHEHAIVRPDGTRVAISVNAAPLFEPDGAFAGMVASISDVTTHHDTLASLADSRTRLELLLTQLPAVVWTVDQELRLTSLAGAGVRSLHPPPTVGDRLNDYFGDAGAGVLAGPRAAMVGETSSSAFWWDDVWWQVAVEPLVGPDGQVRGAVGLALDATREKRALDEVRLQARRLEALFEHSKDAIVLADDSGHLVQVNPATCELAGRPVADLLGRHFRELADDRQPERQLLELVGELPAEGRRGTFVVSRPDGGPVETEYQVTRIQPGLHLAILRDVTARRQAERELAASEARYRDLAENAVEGIFRFRLDPKTYEYVNPAFERLTGFHRDEILADPDLLRRRTHPDDQVPDAHTEPITVRFRRADDTEAWLEVHQLPVRDPAGEVVAIQGVVLDVTNEKRHEEALELALAREQQATEELRRLDRLKDGFLRAVSHELRTPLASVYGFALTLRDHHDELDPHHQTDLLDRLATNAGRLRDLLEDLLDINRLAAGDLHPQLQAVDLAELCHRVLTVVPTAGRAIVTDLPPTPAQLEPAKVERIVHNLVRNAVKHTPDGTTVWVRTVRGDDGAHLVVEDDGPGIPEELRDRVCDPFVQGPDTFRDARPGTGIGLSLVRQFTELHGGTVCITDRPGGGARIELLFPDALPTPAGPPGA